MKVWFESTCNYLRSENHVQLGLISYWHKRKEWKGFTIHMFFLDYGFSLNVVNDFKAYTEVTARKFRIGVRSRK